MTRLTEEIRSLLPGWGINVPMIADRFEIQPPSRDRSRALLTFRSASLFPLAQVSLTPDQFVALRLRGVET